MGTKRHSCNDPSCVTCKKTIYMKKWREDHRASIKKYSEDYNKKYYENNKERIIRETKEYYSENKDKQNARKKEYFEENKEYFTALKKKYWRDNKHIQGAKNKKYYEENKEKINKNQYLKKKIRYYSDPEFRIKECLSARIRESLKYTTHKKNTRTEELLGCPVSELKPYLEKLFLPEMSWDNYGEWHIDHIIPCDSFDLNNPEEQKKCFNYSNLRPLWGADNIKKGTQLNYISDSEVEVLMNIFNEGGVKMIVEIDKYIKKHKSNWRTQKIIPTEVELKELFDEIIKEKDLSEIERVDLAIKVMHKLFGTMSEVRVSEEALTINKKPDMVGDDSWYIVYPGYVDGPNRAIAYISNLGEFNIAT